MTNSLEKNGQKEEIARFRQYKNLKEKHQDAILLFRVGDYYESYEEDAAKVSLSVGISLRRLAGNRPFNQVAGFPFHALDGYLHKLVRAGYRIAICEELEAPSTKNKDKVIVTPQPHTLSRKYLEVFCDMFDRFITDCTKEERDKHRDSISEVKGFLHARIGGAV